MGMNDLRVPTVEVEVKVLCADERSFHGVVFLPAMADFHEGPMRLEEWVNEDVEFFPIQPIGDPETRVMINRNRVAVITFTPPGDPRDDGLPYRSAAVQIECASKALVGTLHMVMPQGRSRVLDYLNRKEQFVPVYDGFRCHLVRKEFIERVMEIEGNRL